MVHLRPTRKGTTVSNRTIATYTEERLPNGPYWTLKVERSASGRPDALLTIRHESFDGTMEPREMMILVADADFILAPIVEWAAQRRAERY